MSKKKKEAALTYLLDEVGLSDEDIKELGLAPHELEILGEASQDKVEEISITLSTSHRLPEDVWKAALQDVIDSEKGARTTAEIAKLALTAIRVGQKLYTMGAF